MDRERGKLATSKDNYNTAIHVTNSNKLSAINFQRLDILNRDHKKKSGTRGKSLVQSKTRLHGSPCARTQPESKHKGSESVAKIGVSNVEQESPQFLAKDSDQQDHVSTSCLDVVSSM